MPLSVKRCKIRAVAECDIEKEVFIEGAYNKSETYDVVMSFLCLESACKDFNSYKNAIKKLTSLIKRGGYLLLYSKVIRCQ